MGALSHGKLIHW